MSDSVENSKLWNKADRRRVRAMRKEGKELTPEEEAVYVLDRQRRRDKASGRRAAEISQISDVTDFTTSSRQPPAPTPTRAGSSIAPTVTVAEKTEPAESRIATEARTATLEKKPSMVIEDLDVYSADSRSTRVMQPLSVPPRATLGTALNPPILIENVPVASPLPPRPRRISLDSFDASDAISTVDPVREREVASRWGSSAPFTSVDQDAYLSGSDDDFIDLNSKTKADSKVRAEMSRCSLWCYDVRKKVKLEALRRRDPIPLWRESLKEIDGRFGSSIAAWFIFARWSFIWNTFLFLFWGLTIEVPYVVNFNWFSLPRISWELVLGDGLELTPFFYGGYPVEVSWYRMDLAYPLVLAVLFTASLLELVRQVQKSRGGQRVEAVKQSDRKLPFSTLMFSAWDHTLTDPEAANILQSGLVNRFRETLEETGGLNLNPERASGGKQFGLIILRIISLLVTCGFIVAGIFIINLTVAENAYLKTYFQLLPTIIVSAVNASFPIVIATVAQIEQWSNPRVAMYLTILRIYVLKLANLIFIVLALYTQYVDTSCPENQIGREFWMLLLIDMVVANAVGIFADGAKYLFGRFRNVPDPRVEFNLISNTIELIYRQALVWIGMIWCPFVPFWAMLATYTCFYSKKFMLFRTAKPPTRAWDASRTGLFFYLTLVATLCLCLVPMTYFFARPHSATDCGPHSIYPTGAQAVFSAAISATPQVVSAIIGWIFNQIVLVLIILILFIAIYFLSSSNDMYQRRLDDVEGELTFEQRRFVRMARNRNKRREGRSVLQSADPTRPGTAGIPFQPVGTFQSAESRPSPGDAESQRPRGMTRTYSVTMRPLVVPDERQPRMAASSTTGLLVPPTESAFGTSSPRSPMGGFSDVISMSMDKKEV